MTIITDDELERVIIQASMNQLHRDTLSLLADSLHNKKNSTVSADKWPAVLTELQAQAVAPLVAKSVANLTLTAQEKIVYMQLLGLSFRNYNNIVIEQNRILKCLSDNAINAVVIKGTSAAKYYPTPEHRSMGDIDILVNPCDFDNARELIISLEYSLDPDEGKNRRHVGFHNENGIKIELHRYFSSVGTKAQCDYLDSRLYSAIEVCENNVLPEVENGLVLIAHIAQHLRSGLGLRQIIDWMMYVEANLTDEFWTNEFIEPVTKCGFATLAKVVTAMCCKYLGLNMSITWCDDADDKAVDDLMEYVMDQGNFGRKKDNSERVTASVFNHFRNPVAFWRYLQAGGKVHWKLARENKFFGCFAWVYQIGHVIRMGLTRKIGLKNLKNSRDESSNIVKLMTDLDIRDY